MSPYIMSIFYIYPLLHESVIFKNYIEKLF